MKKITIITGHYGSGKTNLSVNLAVNACRDGKNVTVVDLDIVNPYFRTADFRELFENMGINLITPDFANTNLDVPSIQFDIEQLAENENFLIIDVGGDDAGAFALGRFADALRKHGDEVEMIYVINQRRYLTENPDEAVNLMHEIETASRLSHTGIVNNTNLGCETTAEIVEQSFSFAEEVAEKTGLPLLFSTCPENISALNGKNNILPVKVYVKPIWEQ